MSILAKRATPIAAAAIATSLSGCAYIVGDNNDVEGVPLAELDMSAPAPDEIHLSGPDRIVITQGDGLVITTEGDADAIDALRFDRSGDKLTIARDQKVYDGSRSATVTIAMPAPSELGVAGSGRIEADTMADDAEIDIAGSGNIAIARIEASKLEVDIAGSGTVTAAGTTQTLEISIAGSGNVRFAELNAEDARVDIACSGDVDLASNGSVAANIAGSGDVMVTGSATCTSSSAGSGTVTCRPAPTAASAAITDDTDSADGEAAAE